MEGFDPIHWKMLKIGDEWKLDVTEETHGDPAKAAAVAESEAKAMEQIAADITNRKLKSDEEVQAAIKAAQVRAADDSK